MQENRKISFIFILLCAFLLGGILGTFLWVALLPLCIVCLIVEKKKRRYSVSFKELDAVDVCIVLICIMEVISCCMGVYVPNSVRRLMPIITIAFFWFFFKEYIVSEEYRSKILFGFSVMGALIAVVTIMTFFITKNRLSEYGIIALNDFKKQITPLGFPLNDWASFLLCLIPYPFIVLMRSIERKRAMLFGLFAALMVTSTLLTLSRSAYVVIAIFYFVSLALCLLYFKNKVKGIFVKMVLCGVLGCLIASPAYKDIMTTCAMTQTTSQLRSNEGRIDLAKNSFSIWKDTPVVGVGGGNFNLAYDYKITDRRTSRSRATNVYLLILVEKGLLGLMAYILMIAVLLIRGFCSVRNNLSILFVFACLMAIFIRGIFFSSMFEHTLVMMLVGVLAFVVSNDSWSVRHER